MPLIETIRCPELSEARSSLPHGLDPSRDTFVSALFRALERHDVRYCALHAQNGLLFSTDFAVHPRDRSKLFAVFAELQESGFQPVQILEPSPGAHRVVFARVMNTNVETRTIDISLERGSVRRENIVRQGSRANKFWALSEERSKRLGATGTSLYLRIAFWVRKLLNHFSRRGAFLVFLGPDGVGKTTLLREVSTNLASIFPEQVLYRWRPAVFARAPRLNCLPHSKPMRGMWSSISYVLFSYVDFWVGYLLSIWPVLSRSGLAMFDRYYHDLLIDPKRYRYAGPIWLAQTIGHLIPPRDILFVVLDAEEQTIHRRKQQLSMDEIRRQRVAYRDFAKQASASVVISTERAFEQCRAIVLDQIVRYLSARLAMHNPAWLTGSVVNAKRLVSRSNKQPTRSNIDSVPAKDTSP